MHLFSRKLCLTLATLWIVAYQAPLSTEFPRQEYWSGLPCSSPGDLPDPGIEPGSPALQAVFSFFFFFTIWATREAIYGRINGFSIQDRRGLILLNIDEVIMWHSWPVHLHQITGITVQWKKASNLLFYQHLKFHFGNKI